MARILIADDDSGFREFAAEALELSGHHVTQAQDGLEALEILKSQSFHVLITDLKMPRMDGLTLLKKVHEEQPELEVLMLTAHGSVAGAVEAMRVGAFDYLEKPLESPDALRLLVARAVERRALRDRTESGSGEEEVRLSWGAPAMLPVIEALRRVSRTDATVLLLGESGVGKEVMARAIHRWSNRHAGPFIPVNCAAFSETLLESELFGHERGAFTGAVQQRRGKLELADGGTFFLDEVGELKPDLQARMLRVLQEKRFERIGGNRTITTDVRWIAATNRDLTSMVRSGGFRDDLFHRLAVFPLRIPALRERREDILPLAEQLLSRISRSLGRPGLEMDARFRQTVQQQSWFGNVRELANTLERAAILTDGRTLTANNAIFSGDFSGASRPEAAVEANAASSAMSINQTTANSLRTLDDLERETIQKTLDQVGGNRRKAADALGIGLRTLYEKLKKYGLG